VWKC